MTVPEVIVVGAGNWGRNLIRNHHELGSLAAVAETSPELRQRIADEFPGVPLLDSLDEAIHQDIPAIVLATPAPTHYEFGMQVLQAGKDVFIEKPMAMHASEAQKLVEYAEAKGRILMVGHLLLYQNAIAWIRDFLATEEAGNVLHVHTTRAKLGKARSQENVWWSFAPHDVSLVLEFLGNPQLEHVSASGSSFLQAGIEDAVHVDLRFKGGQTAHLHTSWYWPHNERRTVIITDRLMITYNEVDQSVTIHDQSIDGRLENVNHGSRVIEGITDNQPLLRECQHFLECVSSRSTPRSDGRNGLAVVEILERAQDALNG